NDYSIGVGLCNDGREPYTAAQYDAAAWLVGELMRRWQIPPRRVVGHCHVSPGLKQDPWLHFHWGRLFEGVVRPAPSIGRVSKWGRKASPGSRCATPPPAPSACASGRARWDG